jgi:heme/copper-type cytochrome/quinol oxidase subunit 4
VYDWEVFVIVDERRRRVLALTVLLTVAAVGVIALGVISDNTVSKIIYFLAGVGFIVLLSALNYNSRRSSR